MRLLMIIIAILGYSLCAAGGYGLYKTDEDRIIGDFKHHISESVRLFEKDLDGSVALLYGLADYFMHSDFVSREEFEAYTDSVMQRAPVIHAIGWMPRVNVADIEQFEMTQQQYFSDFEVRAIVDSAGTVDSAPRQVYYPVTYVAPIEQYEKVAGLDLSAQSERSKAFKKALETQKPTLTEKIWLYSEAGKSTGYMAVLPLRKYSAKPDSPYMGIATVVYSTEKIFSGSALADISDGIEVKILDLNSSEPEEVFVRSLSEGEAQLAYRFVVELDKKLGTTTAIEATPSENYIDAQRSWIPFQLSLLLFVLITLALTNMALLIRRGKQVRELVDVRTEELHKANYKLAQLASTDALTGIANRRSFDEYLAKEFRRAQRHNRALTLMLLDLDYFKDYNDFYGHKSGDECLQDIACTLSNIFQRAEDHVSRFGGEEFAMVLPGVSEAKSLAENAVAQISALEIQHQRSIGFVTVYPSGSTSIDDMIVAADEALYAAKEKGRNTSVQGVLSSDVESIKLSVGDA
jgi:diguanylate cyclase (GGDEF)-like protein